MTLQEFVKTLASKLKITQAKAQETVDAFCEIIGETLAKGDSIRFPALGAFSVKTRNARTSRNPRTGAKMTVPARKVAAFKAGTQLSNKVTGSKPAAVGAGSDGAK